MSRGKMLLSKTQVKSLVLFALTFIGASAVYAWYRATTPDVPPIDARAFWWTAAILLSSFTAFAVAFAFHARKRGSGWLNEMMSAPIQIEDLLPDVSRLRNYKATAWNDRNPDELRVLAAEFEKAVVLPAGGLDGMLATEQTFAVDIGQKQLDQRPVTRGMDPREASRCEYWPILAPEGAAPGGRSLTPEAFSTAPKMGRRDLDRRIQDAFEAGSRRGWATISPGHGGGLGNPRMPLTHDVWFELDVTPGEPESRTFLLHGLVASQPSPTEGPQPPLVILVPGFFDSVEQHYIRDTIGVCFEMGCHVLALDMRDHGDTYRYQASLGQPVPASLGLYEGEDIAGVLRALAAYGIRHRFSDAYLLGYSGGGRAVMLAMEALARAAPEGATSILVHGPDGASPVEVMGALAVSPALSITKTVDGKISYAFYHFFDQLAGIRTGKRLARKDALRILIDEAEQHYLHLLPPTRHDEVKRARGHLPFLHPDLDPARLALAIRRTTIIAAEDDPVVHHAVFSEYREALRAALGPDASLDQEELEQHVIVAKKGGHCGFAVVNQSLTREWFWKWFWMHHRPMTQEKDGRSLPIQLKDDLPPRPLHG